MGVLSEYGIWALCTVGCILTLPLTPQTRGCGVEITISSYLVIVLPARSRVQLLLSQAADGPAAPQSWGSVC